MVSIVNKKLKTAFIELCKTVCEMKHAGKPIEKKKLILKSLYQEYYNKYPNWDIDSIVNFYMRYNKLKDVYITDINNERTVIPNSKVELIDCFITDEVNWFFICLENNFNYLYLNTGIMVTPDDQVILNFATKYSCIPFSITEKKGYIKVLLEDTNESIYISNFNPESFIISNNEIYVSGADVGETIFYKVSKFVKITA